jgi:hypothetical protein
LLGRQGTCSCSSKDVTHLKTGRSDRGGEGGEGLVEQAAGAHDSSRTQKCSHPSLTAPHITHRSHSSWLPWGTALSREQQQRQQQQQQQQQLLQPKHTQASQSQKNMPRTKALLVRGALLLLLTTVLLAPPSTTEARGECVRVLAGVKMCVCVSEPAALPCVGARGVRGRGESNTHKKDAASAVGARSRPSP